MGTGKRERAQVFENFAVDLYLSAQNRMYERTYPVRAGVAHRGTRARSRDTYTARLGTVYIVNGVAGSALGVEDGWATTSDTLSTAPLRAFMSRTRYTGYARMHAELLSLIDDERPKVVEIVHWAASNGDRSENGDYIYGKKRLREIDRRIRFLTKRMELASVTDPAVHFGSDQVFFGATVTYEDEQGNAKTITILGIDEADSLNGQVSWVSPIARALLKSKVGDVVRLQTPAGMQDIEVIQVSYPEKSPD